MEVDSLDIKFAAVSDSAAQGIKNLSSAVKSLSDQNSGITRCASSINSMSSATNGLIAATSRVNAFSTALKALGIYSLQIWAIRKVFKFLGEGVTTASDIVEAQNVMYTSFGNLTNEAQKFISTANELHGLSELQATKYSSMYMAAASGIGVASKEAANMSIELAELAGDIASFYNIDQDTSYTKLMSVFSGQAKPLQQFGAQMTVANLKAYALAEGIEKDWTAMTAAEKAMLRYNYVMDYFTDAQGDFAKTSTTWANQVKQLTNNLSELGSILGKGIIAAVKPFLIGLNQVLSWVVKFGNAVVEAFEAIFGPFESYNVGIVSEDVDSLEDSLDGASASAGALKRQLMGFDEINKLNDSGTIGAVSSILEEAADASTEIVENTVVDLKEITLGYLDTVDAAADAVAGTGYHLDQAAYDTARAWTAYSAGMSDVTGQLDLFVGAIGQGIQDIRNWFGEKLDLDLPYEVFTNDNGLAINLSPTFFSDLKAAFKSIWEDFINWLAGTKFGKYFGIQPIEPEVEVSVILNKSGADLAKVFEYGWNAANPTVTANNGLKTSATTQADRWTREWIAANPTATITNQLSTTPGSLWTKFEKGWGYPTVGINNQLSTSAQTLWENLRDAWGERALKVNLTSAKKLTISDFLSTSKTILNWTPANGANGLSSAINMGTFSFAARGGIVDGATLFGSTVVGEAGREAIIPLENHTEWMDGVAERIASKLPTSGDGQVINVTVTLDGRVVGQSTVQYIRDEARAGRDPLGAYI